MTEFRLNNLKDFNIDHIFDCGQCFRWEKQSDGSYTGAAFGKVVNMKVEENTLIIDNCTEADYEGIWRNYLDIDRDYGKVKEALRKDDPIMAKAISFGYGIRILHQELWETTVSFVISQNNNIPRIKGCIENLAKNFGEKICTYRGRTYFALPTPEKLASLKREDLAEIKLGYRDKFLIETAKAWLGTCDANEESYDTLIEYTGIGPKVANCILLFGLCKYDSFPIDVWVRRVMNSLYNIEEKNTKAMKEFAKERFGEYGGFAQQYLFYYIRGQEQEELTTFKIGETID